MGRICPWWKDDVRLQTLAVSGKRNRLEGDRSSSEDRDRSAEMRRDLSGFGTGGQPVGMATAHPEIPSGEIPSAVLSPGGRRDESEFDETGFQDATACGGMAGDESDAGIAPAESLQHGQQDCLKGRFTDADGNTSGLKIFFTGKFEFPSCSCS